MKFAILRVIA
ncbi:Protein of unknown function [Thermobacillus xylanilyticus]|uniref:Uncharacterized protein n=1 Tax=Thermobacillus xylanilyticus TaxID=76633 RepID=A0ABN7S009_THEXY|nr:Protein of unknown function [Thermobacillus xylanilyticus]